MDVLGGIGTLANTSAIIQGSSLLKSIGFIKGTRQIANFTPDVVIEESIEDTAEITQHPIEDGSVIADHVIDKPIQVSIDAVWQNDLISGQDIKTIYDQLVMLKESHEPFTLQLGKRTLDNMLFTSLSNITNRESESILQISMQFQQIKRVELQTVQVSTPEGEHTKTQQAGKKQAQGSKDATKDGAKDTAEKNNSGLYDLIYG